MSSPKGTRTWSASSLADNGLPSAARRAYERAAQAMGSIDPACQLPWTLLAGVGRVESDHGRYGGSVLGENGVSHPLIIGVALNGVGPVAAIRDTDDGLLDKDKVWDRAVGPMQFIPSTWAGAARDGDGDGVESPNDIDDAALAAAAYLCSGSGSVLGESAMSAAIFRYNASEEYVALVMAMEEGYRTGVFIMPPSVVPRAGRPTEAQESRRAREARGRTATWFSGNLILADVRRQAVRRDGAGPEPAGRLIAVRWWGWRSGRWDEPVAVTEPHADARAQAAAPAQDRDEDRNPRTLRDRMVSRRIGPRPRRRRQARPTCHQ